MGLLDSVLGSVVDIPQQAKDKIQSALDKFAEELKCSHKDLFIMIKPSDEEFNFKCYLYCRVNGKMEIVKNENGKDREVSIEEILNAEE